MTILPVSVDPPDKSRELKARLSLGLELYTDPGGSLARAFGVFDEETEIAITSSFVVKPGGAVAFKYVGADKADRPPVDKLLEAASS